MEGERGAFEFHIGLFRPKEFTLICVQIFDRRKQDEQFAHQQFQTTVYFICQQIHFKASGVQTEGMSVVGISII